MIENLSTAYNAIWRERSRSAYHGTHNCPRSSRGL